MSEQPPCDERLAVIRRSRTEDLAAACGAVSDRWVDAGDQVVTVVRQHREAKHHGPPVEMRFAQVWTFRDGLIARMDTYADREEALEAAGLRE